MRGDTYDGGVAKVVPELVDARLELRNSGVGTAFATVVSVHSSAPPCGRCLDQRGDTSIGDLVPDAQATIDLVPCLTEDGKVRVTVTWIDDGGAHEHTHRF
jgi:hypothetical protein